MSLIKYWNGSAWAVVPDGTAMKYWSGSAWVTANAVWYWSGSAWVKAWTKSSPATYTFYPTFTTNLRWDGANVDYDSNLSQSNDGLADLGLGRYNGEKPYHYTSLLKFDGDATNSATTLVEALAARPVCKSATLRLYRNPGKGLGSPVGYLRMGIWSQLNANLMPATSLDGRYHDWSDVVVNDIAGWTSSTNKVFTVSPQHIYDLAADKSLMFSEVTSGYTTSGGTTNAHSEIYGLEGGSYNTSLVPLLTVNLDLA
jgi:hypothetical protein